MRLDKFLKLARLVKRRTVAQEMIEVGASTKDEVKFVLGSPMDRGKEVWWYNRGWNDAFAVQARDLIQRAHRLSPANPRLTAITEFMHALIKRYGIRPERVMSRLVRNT